MSGIRLILGLELRRFLNQFSTLRYQRKGMKKATVTRKKRGWGLPLLLMFFWLVMIFFWMSTGTKKLVNETRPKEADGKLVVPHKDYFTASFWLGTDYEQKTVSEVAAYFKKRNSRLDEDTAMRYAVHYKQHGEDGFVDVDAMVGQLNFAEFSSVEKVHLAKVFGVVLLSMFLFVLLGPIAMRYKDLASEDVQLEMLFGLPLSGGTILSGRFLSMLLIRPTLWMLVIPFLLFMFYWLSLGAWALVLAVVATVFLGVIAASFELLAETLLRSRGTQKAKKNVQSFCLIAGTLSLYVAMACMISRQPVVLDWLVGSFFGDVAYYLGAVFLMPAESEFGWLWMLGILLTVTICVFVMAIKFSTYSLKNGLTTGGGMNASRALSDREKVGGESKGARLFGGVKYDKYEWLILIRDRALMSQLLAFPLLMLVYQWLMNPEFMDDLSLLTLGMIGYGIGTMGVTMGAPHLVMSEMKSLWVVFTLPMSVAEFFRRRSVFWGGLLTGLSLIVVLVIKFSFGVGLDGDLWRGLVALAAVFVMSRVVFAVMLGNVELPDPGSAQVIKMSQWRFYLCMGLSGICGLYVYQESAWSILACLMIFWFLGDALWQNLSSRLRYIYETIHDEPADATMVDAIKVLLVYFVAQTVLFLMLSHTLGDLGVLISFIAASFIAYVYCGLNERIQSMSDPIAIDDKGGKLAVHWLGWFCATSFLGVAWLAVLASIPQFKSIIVATQVNLSWYMAVLMVVVAPLIEEYIFRKVLFGVMRKQWSFWRSVITSAMLFAVIHPGLSFPPVFLLGVGAAWLYGRTGKLKYSVMLHAGYNLVIYLVHYGWQGLG